MRILNLYAGIGGNAKLWRQTAKQYNQDIFITHVEINPLLCKELRLLFPDDVVLNIDANDYLEYLAQNDMLNDYDIIWSSPPCQTHSRMNRINSKKYHKSSYIDPSYIQQIILLKYNYDGCYFVENVSPYYGVLFDGVQIGRHIIWSNIDVKDLSYNISNKKNLFDLTLEELQIEYGIKLTQNIYLDYPNSHCPKQVYRNAVHPQLGALLLDRFLNRSRQSTLNNFSSMGLIY